MKIKLDENLPVTLSDVLTGIGHDVDTVDEEHLVGYLDSAVWKATQDAGRFLITQDLDFSDTRRFTPGSHHGILLVRLAHPGRRALFERVSDLFKKENVESWSGCFVVATERKLRVRGLGT